MLTWSKRRWVLNI